MAKIRTIKPDFFRHEKLFESEQSFKLPLRIAFAGLFTCCDRSGRFRWRSKQLKLDILPYDEIDFEKILDALFQSGFIKKYQHSNELYGYIPSWSKHQTINSREPESNLPDPDMCTHVHAHAEPVQENIMPISAFENNSLSSDQHMQAHDLHTSAHLEVEGNRKGNGIGSGREGVQQESSVVCTAQSFSIILIPLSNKTEFTVTQQQIDEWQTCFSTIDVLQTLQHIRAWNIANPQKRKTSKGILHHITAWLMQEQKQKSNNAHVSRAHSHADPNLKIAEQWLQKNHDDVGNIIDGEVINGSH